MALNKRVRRRLILLCVLVFVLVVTVVAGYFFTKWNRNRQVELAASEGMSAYLEGDYITALPKLSKAVTYKKEDLDLALALGHTRMRNIDINGRHISASEKYFLHALSLDRENEEALRELVKIYVATGDTTDALTYSDRLPHDDIEIIKSRAAVLRSVGRFDEALDEIGRIRKLSPNDSSWPLYEFTLRRERGDDPESLLDALSEYQQAHPNNQALALTRISLLRSGGNKAEATRIATDLSNLPKIDPVIIIQLQQQLEMLEMNAESEAILARASVLAGDDPEIATALTTRLWRRSEYESALDLSLEAYEAYPEELDFLRMAAALATFVLEEDAADEIHQRLLVDSEADDTARAKVDATSIMAYKSQSAKTIKEMQESLEQIRAARSLDSRNLNLMLMEASILQKTGQSDSAMNLYRDLFVARGSRAAGRQLANLLLQTQQHQNALKQANRLFQSYPSLDSYMIRARAWIALKRSGMDPFQAESAQSAGRGITSRIRATYENTRDGSSGVATPLLPLIAGAAALEDDDDALQFAIDEALQQDGVSPRLLLQIVAINDSVGGQRSDELLQRAGENGASMFDLAYAMAERARNLGQEETALAILEDATSRKDLTGPQRISALKRTLAFMASTQSSEELLTRMREIYDEIPNDHEAARIITSYPGIWVSSPELGQSALDRIAELLGVESSTYIIASARKVISTQINDDAARANSIVALNEVVRKSPESVVAMLVLSDLLRMGNNPDYSGSANYLRRALETRPDQASLYPTIIQLHQKIGDRDRAIEYLQRYQKIAPNMTASRNRVSLFVKQGLTREAILELEGIAAESKSPLDRISLALLLAREGMIEQALAQYDLALELDAENRFAFDGKLILLATTGRVDEALSIARTSELLDARRLMTLEIELFLASSNLEAASEASRELMARFPESVGTWIIVARVRSQTEDLAGARTALRQALVLDPENTIALGQLLPLLVADTNSWDEARGLLPQLQKDAPTLAAVLELKMDSSNPATGAFQPDTGDLARSIQLVSSYPDTVAPRHLAWTMHSIAGDHETALRIAREAMISLPSDPNPALWGHESAVNLREWDTALDLAVMSRDKSPAGRRLEQDMRIAELCLSMGRYGIALDAMLPYEEMISDDELIYAQLPTERRMKGEDSRLVNAFRELFLRVLLLSGRIDDAEKNFMPLLESDQALLNLWTSSIPGMDPSIGRDALVRVAPLLSQTPERRLNLGNNWLQLAKRSDNPEDAAIAAEILDQLLEEESANIRNVMLCKAQLTDHTGEIEKSNRIYRELIDLFTEDEIAVFKGLQELQGRERAEALGLLQVYLAALNNLAYQLKQLETVDREEAIVRIDEAINIAPPGIQPELMDTKAQILAAGGNDEAALRMIEKAIQIAPTRLDLRIRAINLLIRLDRIDQARILAAQSSALTEEYRYKQEMLDQLRALIEEIG